MLSICRLLFLHSAVRLIPNLLTEMNLEKSPLSKLDPTMKKQKDNYLSHWKESTKKQSKLECYLALNREYTVAEYLTTVIDPKQRVHSGRIPDHCD